MEKLDNILDFFRDDMKFRDIECDIKIMDKINYNLFACDEARFSIVLYNLISNSVKHTNKG